MTYTIEHLESILLETKKSFLFFGEYLTQSKKEIGNDEYKVGNQLMQVLLVSINQYDDIVKKYRASGGLEKTQYDYIEDTIMRLEVMNKKIHEEYGDIEFK